MVAVCFAEKTQILTQSGYIAVERLREGDLLAASNEFVPLRWLGRRHIDLASVSNPEELLPVHIKAGALAENTPSRDLRVSPDHALLIEGGLVPAKKLVNGSTIVRERVEAVTYYHVECDRHVILTAEGAAAESYLDCGNRSFFANAPVTALQPRLRDEDALRGQLAAPMASPEAVAAIRERLLARAQTLGHTADGPAEDVHIVFAA